MEGLSKRQKEVYDFIEKYRSQKGFSPSIANIAEGVGLKNSTIATYIEAMKKKGFVTNESHVPRSLLVVPLPTA